MMHALDALSQEAVVGWFAALFLVSAVTDRLFGRRPR